MPRAKTVSHTSTAPSVSTVMSRGARLAVLQEWFGPWSAIIFMQGSATSSQTK